MTLDIQFKIKNNNLYKEYLRSHSYWYKTLTRYPDAFKNFEDEVKKFYKLTTVDRINKFSQTLEMVQTFMSVLK
jgi:hypothetical protein